MNAPFPAMLAAAFLGCACTHSTFTDGAANVRMTNLGSHVQAARISVGGIVIEGWNDNATPAFSETLKMVKGMWSNYLMAEGLKWTAGKYYDHQGKIVDSAKTLELEKLRNAKSKADASAALERLKIETPAAAETIGPRLNPDGSIP